MSALPDLPIKAALPELLEALASAGRAVLEAPPGAGKTTLVPLALLGEPWLGDGRVVMLEPRRMAARAAARRMAAILGEPVGQSVGYRIRLESKVTDRTRVEVVTEGILTRMLQTDAALSGYAAVIFDEFHERNLPSELGLALALESRETLRPDLRLLVMSATLEGARVANLLNDAPRVRSEGRLFPIETRYLDHMSEARIEDLAAHHVHRALAETEGDVLVFLPGAGEIRRTSDRLQNLGREVILAPLYGALPADEQDRAILPSPPGARKVVLATDLAETSLTIEGVCVVIDSGMARRPRFDPLRGMEHLETVRIARDSADQRRGRAGRLGPGMCYRLWTEFEQGHLAATTPPEIVHADLAPLALELAVWGTADPANLRWLDSPPETAYVHARELLFELGALDPVGGVTPHGREMASLGLHPRLAHLVLRGRDLGLGATAARVAAILSERDLLLPSGAPSQPADLRLRLDALSRKSPTVHGHRTSRPATERVARQAASWQRRLRIPDRADDPEATGLLLALAYPDRIAQRRPGSETRYRLRNGQSAALAEIDPLAGSEFLAVAHLGGLGAEPRIFLAAPISPQEIEQHFADQIETVDEVVFSEREERVLARRQQRLGAVVLQERPLHEADPATVARTLLEAIRRRGIEALPWTNDATQIRDRLGFLHRIDQQHWPDTGDAALLERADEWLLPHLYGLRRLDEVQRIDLAGSLLTSLSWEQRQEMDRLAPTHLTVPSGSRIRIDYSDPEQPVLAVRLQEVFGLTETPHVGGGRVPLTVHLLSPARRPMQVTRDLASFWRDAYFDVRKDLRGRYPKHHWPEDPLAAEATRKTKKLKSGK